MKKILITGSSGMVGKNLVYRLKTEQYQLLTPSQKELNLLHSGETLKYIRNNKPALIIHLAGVVGGIQFIKKNRINVFDKNILINRNVILGAYEAGIEKLINIGSANMYPMGEVEPSEDMILNGKLEPFSEPYALSKIMGLKLCDFVNKESKEFQYKSLVPCNLYGPHDCFDEGRSQMIPSIIKRIHHAKTNKIDQVEIWGDGSARREVMYVEDLIDFISTHIVNIDSIPDVINIGVGMDYSVNQCYEEVKEVVDYHGSFVYDKSKPVGVTKRVLDIKLLRQLGWEPKWDLHKGLSHTYDYYKSFINN